jgi:hypothetical protein
MAEGLARLAGGRGPGQLRCRRGPHRNPQLPERRKPRQPERREPRQRERRKPRQPERRKPRQPERRKPRQPEPAAIRSAPWRPRAEPRPLWPLPSGSRSVVSGQTMGWTMGFRSRAGEPWWAGGGRAGKPARANGGRGRRRVDAPRRAPEWPTALAAGTELSSRPAMARRRRCSTPGFGRARPTNASFAARRTRVVTDEPRPDCRWRWTRGPLFERKEKPRRRGTLASLAPARIGANRARPLSRHQARPGGDCLGARESSSGPPRARVERGTRSASGVDTRACGALSTRIAGGASCKPSTPWQ